MVRVIEFLRNCEQETGTRLVTFDFEILFHLYVHGPSASMTLLEATSASLAAFVKTVKRLTENGLLIVTPGSTDRRVRMSAARAWARWEGMNGRFGRGVSAGPLAFLRA